MSRSNLVALLVGAPIFGSQRALPYLIHPRARPMTTAAAELATPPISIRPMSARRTTQRRAVKRLVRVVVLRSAPVALGRLAPSRRERAAETRMTRLHRRLLEHALVLVESPRVSLGARGVAVRTVNGWRVACVRLFARSTRAPASASPARCSATARPRKNAGPMVAGSTGPSAPAFARTAAASAPVLRRRSNAAESSNRFVTTPAHGRRAKPVTFVCDAGECIGDCNPNELRCTDLVPEMCDDKGVWQPMAPCPFLCQDGRCTGTCKPNETKCVGPMEMTCDATGTYGPGVVKPTACGAVCEPGMTKCDGTEESICSPQGQWQSQPIRARVCNAACTPGEEQCRGNVQDKCSTRGAWETQPIRQNVCNAECTPGTRTCDFSRNTQKTCNLLGSYDEAISKDRGADCTPSEGDGCTYYMATPCFGALCSLRDPLKNFAQDRRSAGISRTALVLSAHERSDERRTRIRTAPLTTYACQAGTRGSQ